MQKNIILNYHHNQFFQLQLKKWRQQGKKIILTQGSWDMIHIGHGRYLAKARTHGDVLVVGVDSDEKIRFRKGKDRPIVPQEERLEMLTYFRSVDLVVLKELNDIKWGLVKAVKPDVLIAVEDTYSLAELKELRKICRQVKVLKYQALTSTSAKIRRMQINTAQKIESKLSQRLIGAIEEVLKEFKE